MKSLSFFSLAALLTAACSSSNTIHEHTQFSKLDSLTDTYLVLNDSLLQSWNRIVKDEMDRSKTLKDLINHLADSVDIDRDQLKELNVQISMIDELKVNQKSMIDPHMVEEYDKACAILVAGLSNLSASSETIQSLLRWAEHSRKISSLHRASYDSLANAFNKFVTTNQAALKELGNNGQFEKKPLFWGAK